MLVKLRLLRVSLCLLACFIREESSHSGKCIVLSYHPDTCLTPSNRQAAWFVGNCIANSIGGVAAYGIGHIHSSSLVSWQLIFLILGAVTSAYALVLYLLLPDSPLNAIFLKKHERAIAIQRTLENKTGILDAGKFQTKEVFLALRDPQAWLLVTYTICVNLCNGGVTTVSLMPTPF